MREIKFRCWDKSFKRMKVTGMGINNGVLDGEDVEIMQYIGLKDKNGVEIYEGDIVSYREMDYVHDEFATEKGVVVFKESNAQFYIDGLENNRFWPNWGCEVIGNIHENPELLNPTKQEEGEG